MKKKSHDIHKENPEKVYRDELNNKGTGLFDTKAESDARDAAKVAKAQGEQGRKIDSVDESDFDSKQEEQELIQREREMEEKE